MNSITVNIEEKENLRIDYSKYEVDELVETISDAIFFPLYIGKIVGRVLLITMAIIVVLTIFGTYHWSTGFLFFVLALAITTPSIVLFSVIRLFSTIKADLIKVYNITIETSLYVYKDAHRIRTQRANKIPLKHSFADVFNGVSLYVIRPTLKRVLSGRIKWFSIPIIWLIDFIFKRIFIKSKPKISVTTEGNGESIRLMTEEDVTDNGVKGLAAKIVNTAFGTLKFPFRIALMLYGLINILIIRLLLYLL